VLQVCRWETADNGLNISYSLEPSYLKIHKQVYITLYFIGKMFDCSKSGLDGESLDLSEISLK
jgi:hypothetical protein